MAGASVRAAARAAHRRRPCPAAAARARGLPMGGQLDARLRLVPRTRDPARAARDRRQLPQRRARYPASVAPVCPRVGAHGKGEQDRPRRLHSLGAARAGGGDPRAAAARRPRRRSPPALGRQSVLHRGAARNARERRARELRCLPTPPPPGPPPPPRPPAPPHPPPAPPPPPP